MSSITNTHKTLPYVLLVSVCLAHVITDNFHSLCDKGEAIDSNQADVSFSFRHRLQCFIHCVSWSPCRALTIETSSGYSLCHFYSRSSFVCQMQEGSRSFVKSSEVSHFSSSDESNSFLNVHSYV